MLEHCIFGQVATLFYLGFKACLLQPLSQTFVRRAWNCDSPPSSVSVSLHWKKLMNICFQKTLFYSVQMPHASLEHPQPKRIKIDKEGDVEVNMEENVPHHLWLCYVLKLKKKFLIKIPYTSMNMNKKEYILDVPRHTYSLACVTEFMYHMQRMGSFLWDFDSVNISMKK